MNCLIVDDQQIPRIVLKRMIELEPFLRLVGECADAMEAHKKMQHHQIDLLFLDIEMPGMGGIDFVKSLKGKRPLIIFTTAMPDYAMEAFNLNVVDFLVKPIAIERFLRAVEKVKMLR